MIQQTASAGPPIRFFNPVNFALDVARYRQVTGAGNVREYLAVEDIPAGWHRRNVKPHALDCGVHMTPRGRHGWSIFQRRVNEYDRVQPGGLLSQVLMYNS